MRTILALSLLVASLVLAPTATAQIHECVAEVDTCVHGQSASAGDPCLDGAAVNYAYVTSEGTPAGDVVVVGYTYCSGNSAAGYQYNWMILGAAAGGHTVIVQWAGISSASYDACIVWLNVDGSVQQHDCDAAIPPGVPPLFP